MSTPTLELNIQASGVEEVKALKAALAELNGAVGQLQQYKSAPALEQLTQELRGMRADVKSAMDDIKTTLSTGLKGTFQQAQRDATQGGKELEKAFDDSMRNIIKSIDQRNQEIARLQGELNKGTGGLDNFSSGATRVRKASKEAAEGVDSLAGSVHFGSNAFREAGTLLGEVLGGNFSRVRQSGFALANQMGILKLVFSGTGLVIGGLAASVGVLLAVMSKGEKEVSDFKNAMLLTGDYAGVTRGQFQEMAATIAGQTLTTLGNAKAVLLDLAKTGRFTGDEMGVMGRAIVLQASASGEKLEELVKDYARMPDGIHKWAEEHNKSMHFMSVAQLEHVRLLELQRKDQEAMLEVGNALNKHLEQQTENLGYLEKAWRGIKTTASLAWDSMLGVGREATIDDKLKAAKTQLQGLEDKVKNLPISRERTLISDKIAPIQAEIEWLEHEKTTLELLAKTRSDAQRVEAEGAKASDYLRGLDLKINRNMKEKEALEGLTVAIQKNNAAWKDGSKVWDGRGGFITPDIQKQMESLIHQQYNGTKSALDGVRQMVSAELKEEETLIASSYQTRKSFLDEQHRNALISEGTYLVESLANQRAYETALYADLVKSSDQQYTELQKRIAKIQGLNIASDKKKQMIARETNAIDTWYEQSLAHIQELVAKSAEANTTIIDNYIGQVQKLEKADDTYWAKAEDKLKKEGDLAKSKRDLAAATDEERAVAEAQIKVEDSHEAELRKLQDAYDGSLASLQDFNKELALGPPTENTQAAYQAVAAAANSLRVQLEKARAEIDKLKGEASTIALDEVQDKKIEELRNNAKSLAKTTAASIVDGLVEGGKKGAQKIRDAVKQAFLSPIKVYLQGVMQPIANGLVNMGMNMLGMGSSGSGVSSLFNMGSSASSATSMFAPGGVGDSVLSAFGVGGSGIGGAATTAATIADTAASTSAGLLEAGATAEEAAAASEALAVSMTETATTVGAFGGGMAAAMAAIPVVGWIAAAGVLLYSVFGGKGGGPKTESFYNYTGHQDSNTGQGSKALYDSIQGGYGSVASTLGASTNKIEGLGTMISADPQGTAKTQLDVTLPGFSRGSLYGTIENVGRSDDELKAATSQAVAQAIIAGLLNSDIDQKFKDYLKGIDLKSSAEDLSARIADVVNVKKITNLFKPLGDSFAYVQNMSVEAVKTLADLGGGFDALSQKLSNFYNNYYTEDEKNAYLTQYLTGELAKMNLVLPKSREEYKKLMEAQDLTTTAGAATFNTLLNLSDAFAQLTANTTDLTGATKTQAQLDQAVTDARSALQSSYTTEVDRLTNLRDRMQAFNDKMAAFLKELTSGDLAGLTPQQQYLAAKAAFQQDAQNLNSTDPTVRDAALSDIEDAGKALLEASRTMFGASDGYYTDLAAVKTAVEQAQEISKSGVDVATQQLTALDSLVQGLVDLRTTDQTSLSALYDVTGSGLAAVVAAIAALQAATLAATPATTTAATLTADTAAQTLLNTGGGSTTGGTTSNTSSSTSDAVTAITSYYQQYLGRAPETGGLNYYLGLYGGGVSLATIADAISTSPEAIMHSHAVPLRAGLDRVPYDGFPATLHKDEAVLNAAEAEKRRSQLADQDEVIRSLEARLASLEATVADGLDNVVAAQFASTDQAAGKIASSHEKALSKNDWGAKTRDGAKIK